MKKRLNWKHIYKQYGTQITMAAVLIVLIAVFSGQEWRFSHKWEAAYRVVRSQCSSSSIHCWR